jgi:hypothetical protein
MVCLLTADFDRLARAHVGVREAIESNSAIKTIHCCQIAENVKKNVSMKENFR